MRRCHAILPPGFSGSHYRDLGLPSRYRHESACKLILSVGRYPILKGCVTSGRFVTTIHAMNSGVLKLSVFTPITKVYRGAAGMKMPAFLVYPDEFNSRLGIEMGFMSTTTDPARGTPHPIFAV